MTVVVPTAEEIELAKDAARLLGADHVVVCLGGLSVHVNGAPTFSVKTYGPFTEAEVGEKAREILHIEGGAVFVRPLVDLADTYRRLSAD
jgi:hypothetical protein